MDPGIMLKDGDVARLHPFQKTHFGQLGEDVLLWHLLHTRFDGFYIDVGCHHPNKYSNTFLLHKYRRWKGINIDADSRAIELMREARPEDINIFCGVGSTEGSFTFQRFENGAVSTFDDEMSSKQKKSFALLNSNPVPVRRLDNILADNLSPDRAIDYLNVDCEAKDLDVLQSNDWTRFRPEFVTVEIHDLNLMNAMAHATVVYMADKGYKLISHTLCTSLFKRSN